MEAAVCIFWSLTNPHLVWFEYPARGGAMVDTAADLLYEIFFFFFKETFQTACSSAAPVCGSRVICIITFKLQPEMLFLKA